MVEQQTTEFQASTPFVLGADSSISAADLGLVFNLYMPFLGPKAFALYQFLVEEEAGMELKGKRSFSDHYLIMDSLSMSVPDLVRARHALEAVSLLKSYSGTAMGSASYRYVLKRPLTAAAFFKEDLLSGLLFHYVGEERYLALAQRYQGRKGKPLNDEVDQSASFLKVFGMPEATQKPTVSVADGTAAVEAGDWGKVGFDFVGMCELVHGTTKETLDQYLDLIMTQQVLYGLNESEMATAITRSINLDDHDLNKKAFFAYLMQNWDSRRQSEQMADLNKNKLSTKSAPEQGSITEQTSGTRQPKKMMAPKSAAQKKQLQALFDSANALSPFEFANDIKQRNNGFISSDESATLSYLINKKTLPVPVINIMIYHVLINLDRAVLSRQTMDTIANDWGKNNVQTVQDAVAAIEAYQKKRLANSRGPRNWSNRPTKQEPAFAKNKETQDSVDQEAVKRTLDIVNKYKKKD
ncbi:hypothetical protein G6R29_04005 [Fructobacillus sp. M2-14]|uniref:Uncharacterized protein n=1 Tax=Fructobacillus broussonetiae TaxID=2713173 RepID=A0ABS5R3Q5_9LACO|nr:DnaD domain protein [Fructobacillus broussonetiae]MBS9338787.1 hypothetical protein [Fructobacillus broussonetiae]